MKKKKIAALSLAALVAGTGAFHAYSNYQQSGESDALLNENILALSSESEGDPCIIEHFDLNEKDCWAEYYEQKYTYTKYNLPTITKTYEIYTNGNIICLTGNDALDTGGYEKHEEKSGTKQKKIGVYRWCEGVCSHLIDAWNKNCPHRCDRREQITCSKFKPGCNGSTLAPPRF